MEVPRDVDAKEAAGGGADECFEVRVDTVDIIVNGEVVWSAPGLAAPGTKTYTGTVALPAGDWIAAERRGAGLAVDERVRVRALKSGLDRAGRKH